MATQTFTVEIGDDAHGPWRGYKPGHTEVQHWARHDWRTTISLNVKRPPVYPCASDIWLAEVTIEQID